MASPLSNLHKCAHFECSTIDCVTGFLAITLFLLRRSTSLYHGENCLKEVLVDF